MANASIANGKRVVLMLHPVTRQDVQASIWHVCAILRAQHNAFVLPQAPYLVPLLYLNQGAFDKAETLFQSTLVLIERNAFDEIWLFGDGLSEDMRKIVSFAQSCKMPVVPKTEATRRDLALLSPNLT